MKRQQSWILFFSPWAYWILNFNQKVSASRLNCSWWNLQIVWLTSSRTFQHGHAMKSGHRVSREFWRNILGLFCGFFYWGFWRFSVEVRRVRFQGLAKSGQTALRPIRAYQFLPSATAILFLWLKVPRGTRGPDEGGRRSKWFGRNDPERIWLAPNRTGTG